MWKRFASSNYTHSMNSLPKWQRYQTASTISNFQTDINLNILCLVIKLFTASHRIMLNTCPYNSRFVRRFAMAKPEKLRFKPSSVTNFLQDTFFYFLLYFTFAWFAWNWLISLFFFSFLFASANTFAQWNAPMKSTNGTKIIFCLHGSSIFMNTPRPYVVYVNGSQREHRRENTIFDMHSEHCV